MTDTIQVGTNYIVKTPGTLGGRARIDGTRMGVADVVNLYVRNKMPVEQITDEYPVTLAQIYAALAYYYDHPAEIDDYLDEYERQSEEHAAESSQQREELLSRLKERDPEKYDRLTHIREAVERDKRNKS